MEPVERAVILKEELDALRPISKEQELRIMQKFRLDWNYHSNRIEGNSLTYGETKALILFGLTAQGKPLKDHIEIEGHNKAIEWILDIVKGDYPLTESFIREIHTLLLKESYTVDAITAEGLPTKKRVEIGKYKNQPNHVLTNTGEIFRFAAPEETPAMMGELVDWYRQRMNSTSVNPILLAAEFHYKFIRIHPFDDGNGRTARILMNFILMQFNYPPVIIKTEEKQQYFAALRQADSGIFEPFLNFIAANLVQSLDLMIRGAKGENIEDPGDFDKELALLEKRLLSKKPRIEKNSELILKLYDNSIQPLFNAFFEQSRKFEKFYNTLDYSFVANNYSSDDMPDAISEYRQKVNERTSFLTIVFLFKHFKYTHDKNFDFHSSVSVLMAENTFTVTSTANIYKIEKTYHDMLSSSEIGEIIGSELKRHKDYIESHTDVS
ncbi:Fic family protein [Dyadobacter chenwenxiniae]|uniref:Fic family protein n=1 Tax=Dyadobacter chenwenxiniae TaxID=2906456 RepID=A0A9X1TFB7_9BACT|nr:Fic family protein [Dyadobacter chenwenxiniae]MCF0062500.1 Fic family protein [Dyadobacter chenwenxiniae]UON83754.1 Fic family protein [Dyadobacter chenwenxiniae]